MVLEWTPQEATLLQDRPLSAAASVYISREAWETQNNLTFYSISPLGTLGPGDRRLCRLVLVSFTLIYSCHYMRHPTIDLFLLHLKRASETQNHLTFSYWVPEHQGTVYFMRSECIKLVLVSFTLIYTRCQLHVH